MSIERSDFSSDLKLTTLIEAWLAFRAMLLCVLLQYASLWDLSNLFFHSIQESIQEVLEQSISLSRFEHALDIPSL
jgi:hypothetical protein